MERMIKTLLSRVTLELLLLLAINFACLDFAEISASELKIGRFPVRIPPITNFSIMIKSPVTWEVNPHQIRPLKQLTTWEYQLKQLTTWEYQILVLYFLLHYFALLLTTYYFLDYKTNINHRSTSVSCL